MDAIKRLFETQPLDSRWVSGLALAQGCAFLTALSATASTALANRGASAPAWQSFFIYVLLGGFYVPYHARQKSRESEADDASGAGGHGTGFTEPAPPPPSSPPLSTGLTPQGTSSSSRTPARYALLAFIDTQANYWIVKAFRYTSLTSVTLLDCAAVPFSMALSLPYSAAATPGLISRAARYRSAGSRCSCSRIRRAVEDPAVPTLRLATSWSS